jgi:polyisoprenoid-binding protein YceI
MSAAPSSTETGRVYAIDPAHTSAAFVVRHMMISKVRGHFNSVAGTIELPPEGNVPLRLEATIDVASIDTREPQRDAHLKSADFLDAETYPQISFRSLRIEGTEDSFRIHGDLTIHGTTHEVVLDATFEGAANDPYGNKRVGYEAVTKINRKDFGLSWNQALETGGALIGDEVRIELTVEAIAQS